MEKIVSVQHLRDAGLLGAEYTRLELCDAFLMYWISNNKTDKNRIILRDGSHTLDRMNDGFASLNPSYKGEICRY